MVAQGEPVSSVLMSLAPADTSPPLTGLALCAIQQPSLSSLFPPGFFPSAPAKSALHSSLFSWGRKLPVPSASYFSPGPSAPESFAAACARRERDSPRSPQEGLSAFTILDRVGSDPQLDPGFWDAPEQAAGLAGDDGRLGEVLRRGADRIGRWCDEWRFSGEKSIEYEDEGVERVRRKVGVVGWEEVADKAEELVWVATSVYAATTRPGYEGVRLDYHL